MMLLLMMMVVVVVESAYHLCGSVVTMCIQWHSQVEGPHGEIEREERRERGVLDDDGMIMSHLSDLLDVSMCS